MGLRICCFEKEVLLLFPQKMRTCGTLSDWCGLMDQDHLKGCHECPQKENTSPNKKQEAVWKRTTPQFPNIVYKCLFVFKGGYAIEICIGMDLGLLMQI